MGTVSLLTTVLLRVGLGDWDGLGSGKTFYFCGRGGGKSEEVTVFVEGGWEQKNLGFFDEDEGGRFVTHSV